MTNELNYIRAKPRRHPARVASLSLSLFLCVRACVYVYVSERGASSRETRSSGNLVLSFLSSPMVVHRLLIRFIFNSTERKAIVRGHDSSRCVKTVGSCVGFSIFTKMEQEKKEKAGCLVKEIGLDATTTQCDVTKTSSTISRGSPISIPCL